MSLPILTPAEVRAAAYRLPRVPVAAQLGIELDEFLAAKAEEFRAAGRRPYVWDRKHSKPVAAVSYTVVVAEIVEQLRALGTEPGAIYVCSAGSTGAGTALGKA